VKQEEKKKERKKALDSLKEQIDKVDGMEVEELQDMICSKSGEKPEHQQSMVIDWVYSTKNEIIETIINLRRRIRLTNSPTSRIPIATITNSKLMNIKGVPTTRLRYQLERFCVMTQLATTTQIERKEKRRLRGSPIKTYRILALEIKDTKEWNKPTIEREYQKKIMQEKIMKLKNEQKVS